MKKLFYESPYYQQGLWGEDVRNGFWCESGYISPTYYWWHLSTEIFETEDNRYYNCFGFNSSQRRQHTIEYEFLDKVSKFDCIDKALIASGCIDADV
jgi:hypothetical protein